MIIIIIVMNCASVNGYFMVKNNVHGRSELKLYGDGHGCGLRGFGCREDRWWLMPHLPILRFVVQVPAVVETFQSFLSQVPLVDSDVNEYIGC